MLRSILAIIAGYIVMAVLTVASIATSALVAGIPLDAGNPPPWLPTTYLVATLVLGILAAGVGGWVCTWIARRTTPTWILAGLVLLMGVLYALGTNDPVQPRWHLWSLPITGALGTALGGWTSRRPGRRPESRGDACLTQRTI